MSNYHDMDGFGAQVQEPAKQGGNPILEGPSIFRISNKQGENRCTVVLVDDQPKVRYRHYIKVPYVPGRKGTRKDVLIREARMTCGNARSNKPVPQECKLCEAALRHDDKIKRKFTSNLTLIDQRIITTKKGHQLVDMKKLLELDYSFHMVFKEKMQASPDGRLAPKQWSVMRPTGDATQSRTFGDSWTELRSLVAEGELLRFFWESKAVPAIMEAAKKAGTPITWQQAVERIIAPLDPQLFDNYDPELAQTFIMVALGGDYAAEAQNQQSTYQQMGGNGAPPPFPGQAPAMPAGAVPNQPMAPPAGPPPAYQQAPVGAVGAPPPAPPMGQPPMAPPGAPPQAPPMTADPTQPQQGYAAPQAPPMPQQGYPAPQAPPAQYAPPQAPQGAPPAQPAPQHGQYQFGAAPTAAAPGWSAQFPGQQPVAPPQAPPQQQAMQPPPAPVPQQAPPPAGAPGQVPTGINPGF